MRILNFIAENFKRIQIVEIKPDGSLVDVKGRNGQGKSSVLDAVWAALGGLEAVPGEPIRKGEQRARIELALGEGDKVELVVKRTFVRGVPSQIAVEAPDGARYAKPQTILDGLLGALSFDPLAFTRMPAKEQVQQLRALVPDVDFEAIDNANRRDFAVRTEVNRDARSLRTRLAAMTVPGDPRQQRIDESALVAELEAAGKLATDIVLERQRREKLADEAAGQRELANEGRAQIAAWRNEIDELNRRIERVLRSAATYEAAAVKTLDELAALPQLATAPDTMALRARIDAARKNNLDVDTRERVMKERAELDEQAKVAEKKSQDLSEMIAARDQAKAAAVKAANLPVDGLTLGDEAVLYNGLPLDQASDAERLRVSVAIAAAMNPKLRVIRVRDGSLLDDDGLALLAQFAEKHELQIWLERVASNAKTGIILEDGRLKASEAAA